jgi:ADP-ribose pyrophosphatase
MIEQEIKKIEPAATITQKEESYPDRFKIEPDTTWENLDKQNYNPPYFVSTKVLANPVWADSEDISKVYRNMSQSYEGNIFFDENGRPLNPKGPTGIEGRGVLGKWGANFAADPIVTRINDEGFLEMIVIKRKDCGKWAIPGGMVDKGERITTTLSRELGEETSANLSFENALIIYQGYVNDPRNTDNAWMETDAYHLHLTTKQAEAITLKADDDAEEAKWMVCDQKNIEKLYASHSSVIKQVIYLFQKNNNLTVLEDGKICY